MYILYTVVKYQNERTFLFSSHRSGLRNIERFFIVLREILYNFWREIIPRMRFRSVHVVTALQYSIENTPPPRAIASYWLRIFLQFHPLYKRTIQRYNALFFRFCCFFEAFAVQITVLYAQYQRPSTEEARNVGNILSFFLSFTRLILTNWVLILERTNDSVPLQTSEIRDN